MAERRAVSRGREDPPSHLEPFGGRERAPVSGHPIRILTEAVSELRPTCDRADTPLVTWRGRRLTPGTRRSNPAGATWTIWALGGGAFVYATPLSACPSAAAARPAEAVDVFIGVRPSEAHVDIALLEMKQDNGFHRQDPSYLIARLREKAGELGCDAVFIEHISEREEAAQRADPTLLATCIVYTRLARSLRRIS
jgi:hypothetical protein